MSPMGKRNHSGVILIYALWILGLLAVFTLTLGKQIRQKIILVGRLEKREEARTLARAGVLKAIAVLNQDLESNGRDWTPATKQNRLNDPARWANVPLGDGSFSVSYQFSDGAVDSQKSYGMMDEEGRLNLNKADETFLRALLKEVLGGDPQEIDRLAVSIVDWRKKGSSELSGFYSDEYYANLRDPYPVKDSDYETLDELLLVRGMTPEIFAVLKNYVTFVGDGKINVNTASRPVLLALGLEAVLVDELISLRRGADGLEGTSDDFIFARAYDIAGDLVASGTVKPEEIGHLEELNARGILGTESAHYRIAAVASLVASTQKARVLCVYDALQKKIRYWKEELVSE